MARSKQRYAAQAEFLADAMRRARKTASMSQQSLAESAAISIGTVRNIEQGAVKDPGLFEIVAIAQALGVPVSEFLDVGTDLKLVRGTTQAGSPSRELTPQHGTQRD